jgi:hypothetical protein
MVEATDPCAFPPCPREAVVTVRLLVEGCEAVVPTCEGHTRWLRSYAEEDAAVQVSVQEA